MILLHKIYIFILYCIFILIFKDLSNLYLRIYRLSYMYELNTRVYRKGVQWIVLQGTLTINVLRKNLGAMDPLLGRA